MLEIQPLRIVWLPFQSQPSLSLSLSLSFCFSPGRFLRESLCPTTRFVQLKEFKEIALQLSGWPTCRRPPSCCPPPSATTCSAATPGTPAGRAVLESGGGAVGSKVFGLRKQRKLFVGREELFCFSYLFMGNRKGTEEKSLSGHSGKPKGNTGKLTELLRFLKGHQKEDLQFRSPYLTNHIWSCSPPGRRQWG